MPICRAEGMHCWLDGGCCPEFDAVGDQVHAFAGMLARLTDDDLS